MKRFLDKLPATAPRARQVLTTLMISSMALASHIAVATTPATDQAKIEVRYDDLNLSNATGTAAVQRRIRQAADRACGGRDSRDLRRVVEYQRCTHDATTKALAQVNRPKPNRS